jgi:hypothetical protein
MTYELDEDMALNLIFRTRVAEDESFAQNVYAALCNNEFIPDHNLQETWSCSWRAAGEYVANLRNQYGGREDIDEDYLTWYCSGLVNHPEQAWVEEGQVTDAVREAFKALGWSVVLTNETRGDSL